MNIYQLRALKKELIKANTPSMEKQIALALNSILMDSGDLPKDKALKILGWEEDPLVEASKISICTNEGHPPVVIARGGIIPNTEGAKVVNVVKASSRVKRV
ncbi:MAG: hypothetical protein ACLT0R_17535 [Paraclostridium sordellii]